MELELLINLRKKYPFNRCLYCIAYRTNLAFLDVAQCKDCKCL